MNIRDINPGSTSRKDHNLEHLLIENAQKTAEDLEALKVQSENILEFMLTTDNLLVYFNAASILNRYIHRDYLDEKEFSEWLASPEFENPKRLEIIQGIAEKMLEIMINVRFNYDNSIYIALMSVYLCFRRIISLQKVMSIELLQNLSLYLHDLKINSIRYPEHRIRNRVIAQLEVDLKNWTQGIFILDEDFPLND